jgi:hypothetical protein
MPGPWPAPNQRILQSICTGGLLALGQPPGRPCCIGSRNAPARGPGKALPPASFFVTSVGVARGRPGGAWRGPMPIARSWPPLPPGPATPAATTPAAPPRARPSWAILTVPGAANLLELRPRQLGLQPGSPGQDRRGGPAVLHRYPLSIRWRRRWALSRLENGASPDWE